MLPTLFHFEHWTLHSYGVAIVVGAALGTLWAWRWRPAGLFGATDFLNICLLATLGASVAARLAGPGLSSLGVPLVVIPLLVVYCRLRRLDWRTVLDHLTPFGLFGATFQRVFGCFLAGCCAGRPTDLGWGVSFPGSPDAVHPTQLYLGAGLFAAFLLLVRWRLPVAGQKACLAVGLYGLVTALVTPLRAGLGDPWLLGFTAYGWFHAALMLLTLVAMVGLGRLAVPARITP